jgi:hypothetical protein
MSNANTARDLAVEYSVATLLDQLQEAAIRRDRRMTGGPFLSSAEYEALTDEVDTLRAAILIRSSFTG